MIPKNLIKELYCLVLKEKRAVRGIGVFPGNLDTRAFVMYIGDWWYNDNIDKRFMTVSQYIDLTSKLTQEEVQQWADRNRP